MTLNRAIFHLYRKIAHAFARGLVALLILSHGSLALSSAISPSHDPLRVTTHAHALAKADSDHDGHGHSHEVFDDEGKIHKHGHNPADHSHDKPNVPPTHAMSFPPLSNQWAASEHRLAYPAPSACLERPPKGLSIA